MLLLLLRGGRRALSTSATTASSGGSAAAATEARTVSVALSPELYASASREAFLVGQFARFGRVRNLEVHSRRPVAFVTMHTEEAAAAAAAKMAVPECPKVERGLGDFYKARGGGGAVAGKKPKAPTVFVGNYVTSEQLLRWLCASSEKGGVGFWKGLSGSEMYDVLAAIDRLLSPAAAQHEKTPPQSKTLDTISFLPQQERPTQPPAVSGMSLVEESTRESIHQVIRERGVRWVLGKRGVVPARPVLQLLATANEARLMEPLREAASLASNREVVDAILAAGKLAQHDAVQVLQSELTSRSLLKFSPQELADLAAFFAPDAPAGIPPMPALVRKFHEQVAAYRFTGWTNLQDVLNVFAILSHRRHPGHEFVNIAAEYLLTKQTMRTLPTSQLVELAYLFGLYGNLRQNAAVFSGILAELGEFRTLDRLTCHQLSQLIVGLRMATYYFNKDFMKRLYAEFKTKDWRLIQDRVLDRMVEMYEAVEMESHDDALVRERMLRLARVRLETAKAKEATERAQLLEKEGEAAAPSGSKTA